ncbi:MAG: 5'-nucleotidase C-terminal domain-containing protein [Pseudomonadota bacterium]
MRINRKITAAIATVALGCAFNTYAESTEKITIIHIGDTHGQIEPAVNVRSDNTNKDLEGGLARMFTLVKKIRHIADARGRTHFTFLVGDTSHGGVEVTFTRGDGIVGILNEFDIDLFAPGNWEFTYGTCRANELWGFTDTARGILDTNSRIKDTSDGTPPPFHPNKCDFGAARLANWTTLASNAYIDNDRNSANCPPVGERTRLFEPYRIVTDPGTGINIGVIAFTTERGPRVIGNPVVEGICFTKGDEEIIELVELMNTKRQAGEVDMVVMTSELNHANNRRLIDMVDDTLGAGGVDLVLSADMHEKTPRIIYTKNGTAMVSQGQDGSHLGELNLTFKDKKLSKIDFRQHRVEEAVKEDPEIAEMVEAVREPFLNGTSNARHFVHGRMIPKDIVNPGEKHFGVEEPLAIAGMDLNRNNFIHEFTAAIYEGTLHSLFTDALRATGKQLIDDKWASGGLDVGGDYADLCTSHDATGACESPLPVMGLIRGFRYAASVRAGEPITLETLYHIAPIGPFATVGVVTGEVLLGRGAANNQAPTANGLEHAAHLSLSTNVSEWGGGWLQTYAGMKYSINPYAAKDHRIPDGQVLIGTDAEGYTPVDREGKYIIVGYGFNDVVFGTDSGANEYVFVNKPFKMNQASLSNIWRIVFDNEDYSTLDSTNNPLDLVAVPFSADGTNPDINSLPVVDLVARHLLDDHASQAFMLQEPVSRVNVLCHQPDMAAVKNTKNSQILDADFPIVDIGFSMIQSIFGANRNLIQYLNDGRLQECVDNGIIEINSGQITYIDKP